MGKRILFFGPPGVGKGTHSKRLARDCGVPHVSTGDIFREAIREGSALGRQADEFIQRGELVPDDLVVAVLEQRLSHPDARDGYLLDGFPRTVPQAQVLEKKLRSHGQRMDAVLSLEAPQELLVRRLSGRATCPQCHTTFNRHLRPPKTDGVCDQCGSPLVQRPDDMESTVRRRLNEYVAKTTPVLDFFKSEAWPVHAIASVGDVEEVYRRIREAVEAR